MRIYFRDMGATENLANDMLAIDPDRMRYLSRAVLDSYGIGERRAEGDPEQRAIALETLQLKSAQAYGLDRREYMRRQALIEKNCTLDADRGGYTAYGERVLMGETAEQLKPDLEYEAAAWSRCFKSILTYGR